MCQNCHNDCIEFNSSVSNILLWTYGISDLFKYLEYLKGKLLPHLCYVMNIYSCVSSMWQCAVCEDLFESFAAFQKHLRSHKIKDINQAISRSKVGDPVHVTIAVFIFVIVSVIKVTGN